MTVSEFLTVSFIIWTNSYLMLFSCRILYSICKLYITSVWEEIANLSAIVYF